MCTNMACHTEHYMEGRQYPLEIHFVHMNTKYSALGDAAQTLRSSMPAMP